MAETVIRIEDILNPTQEEPKKVEKNKKGEKPKKIKNPVIPRGKPKSGRVWKSVKTRCKSTIKTRGLRRANTVEKSMKLKEDLKRVKAMTVANKEERKQQIESKKERRRENLKRQAINQLKSEIVQVINNPAKIKRMKKKQLKQIQKRDTTKIEKI